MSIKAKLKNMALDLLSVISNPRSESNYNLAGILPSMVEFGLFDPLTVRLLAPKDGIVRAEILKGHRRHRAILAMQKDEPEAFAKWFADGIPCWVYEGLSDAEASGIKNDHGEVQALGLRWELIKVYGEHAAHGLTEGQILARIDGLIDQVIGHITKDARDFITLREAQASDFLAKGDKIAAAIARKEAVQRKEKARHGTMQHLSYAWKSPAIVKAALAKRDGDTFPEVYKTEVLPDLTQDEVKSLCLAHQKDLESKTPEGLPMYNADLTGPAFKARWAEIVAAVKPVGEKSPKAMAAKAIAAEINEGKWKSLTVLLAAQYFGGKKEAQESLMEMDKIAHAIDFNKVGDKVLFDAFIKRAGEIEAETIKADMAKTAAPQETEAAPTNG